MTRDELGQCSFLIVDDDEFSQDVMIDVLRYIGGQTFYRADSCDAALRLAQQHQPDYVLLDIYMPAVDGWATLDRLRQLLPNVVVLMITGSVRPEDFNRSMDQRVDGYCIKPVLPNIMLKSLLQAKHYRSNLRPVLQ